MTNITYRSIIRSVVDLIEQNVLVTAIFEVQYYRVAVVDDTCKMAEFAHLVGRHELRDIAFYCYFGVVEDVYKFMFGLFEIGW